VVSGFQYDKAFFLDLIPDYMEGVYPVQPVIPEAELQDYIRIMDTDQEVRCFVCTFGACTLNLTRTGNKRTEEVLQNIEGLMNYAIANTKPPYKNFHSSVMRAMQSMFIHNCLMSMSCKGMFVLSFLVLSHLHHHSNVSLIFLYFTSLFLTQPPWIPIWSMAYSTCPM